MRPPTGFLEVLGRRLEYAWHGSGPEAAPTLVFLHEGLGSVAQWRDIPEALAARTGCGALVYSRFGYGGSDACELPRPISYMHDEGLEVLPAVLRAAGIARPILVGHSDGASIALIYAGGTPAEGLAGMVLEAPHVFAEPCGIESIRRAAAAYREGDLRARLARYHGANVDCAFRGWAGAWSDPAFAHWNLEDYLPAIRAPSLVVQGEEDEYGTAAQVESIRRRSGGPVEVLMLAQCGHAPHKDRREDVLAAITRFVRRVA